MEDPNGNPERGVHRQTTLDEWGRVTPPPASRQGTGGRLLAPETPPAQTTPSPGSSSTTNIHSAAPDLRTNGRPPQSTSYVLTEFSRDSDGPWTPYSRRAPGGENLPEQEAADANQEGQIGDEQRAQNIGDRQPDGQYDHAQPNRTDGEHQHQASVPNGILEETERLESPEAEEEKE